jgi:hypothetical protein
MVRPDRIGATGDSQRMRNNEWFLARSNNSRTDIRIFKVNNFDEIEFFSMPSIAGDSFVLQSQFQALEDRVAVLEAIVGSLTAGNVEIFPTVLTPLNVSSKSITLPNPALSNNTAMIIPANGIPQLQGVDFNIVGSQIIWSGMPYESVAADGDIVKIVYMFSVS